MPSKHPALISLRGDGRYARALDRLLKSVKARGFQVDSRHQLAELAITLLALNHDIKMPARTQPVGTNRHGPPKTPA